MRSALAGALLAGLSAGSLAGALAGAGCRVSPVVGEAARDVLTLRSGTITGLKALRGSGPFTRYEVAPEAMLDVLAAACRKARDLGGRPVTSVTISRHYGEVTAKEHAPDAPADPGYSEEWRTAVVATVHPLAGEPGACRVEVHAARRSPLMGGANLWERDLPGWIDEVLRERGRREQGLSKQGLSEQGLSGR